MKLDELAKVTNSIPSGDNDDITINLPKEALAIAKQYVKTSFVNSKIIGFIVLAIVIVLIWYFLLR